MSIITVSGYTAAGIYSSRHVASVSSTAPLSSVSCVYHNGWQLHSSGHIQQQAYSISQQYRASVFCVLVSMKFVSICICVSRRYMYICMCVSYRCMYTDISYIYPYPYNTCTYRYELDLGDLQDRAVALELAALAGIRVAIRARGSLSICLSLSGAALAGIRASLSLSFSLCLCLSVCLYLPVSPPLSSWTLSLFSSSA